MRNFDVRLDEIRRRSEILKQKQRQRRRLALTVIPAALCVALCAAAAIPGWTSGQKTEGTSDGLWQSGGASGHGDGAASPTNMPLDPGMHIENFSSLALSVTSIQIIGNGVDRTVDHTQTVADICALWSQIAESPLNYGNLGAPASGMGEQPNDGDSTVGKTQPKGCYTVSFLNGVGVLCRYRLDRYVLTDSNTGEMYSLEASEAAALYALLGIVLE